MLERITQHKTFDWGPGALIDTPLYVRLSIAVAIYVIAFVLQKMPVMDGYAAMAPMKNRSYKVPVIALTATPCLKSESEHEPNSRAT